MSEPDQGGLSVFAALGAQLGRVADRMEYRERRSQKLFDSLHQVTIGPSNIVITAGAGALDQTEQYGPKAGFMWSVRRITASGYSAGSVVVFKNGTLQGGVIVGGSEPVAPFAAAGVLTFGRGDLLLDQNDSLTIVCTGITVSAGFAGVQINGAADNFIRELLPEYLG